MADDKAETLTEARREISRLRRELSAAKREARELRAGIEGSPVAGRDVANRTALGKFRNATFFHASMGMQRWFNEIQAGQWEQALFDGVVVVAPDLATLQLSPALNPSLVQVLDDLRRVVTDPGIARGMALAAEQGYKLSHIRDDLMAALVQVYRRGHWWLAEESIEIVDEGEER